MMNIQWDSQALDFMAVLRATSRKTMEQANNFCGSVDEAKQMSNASTIKRISLNEIHAFAPNDAVLRSKMLSETCGEISIYLDGCIVHVNGELDERGYIVATEHCVIPDFDGYGDAEIVAFVHGRSDERIRGVRLPAE